MPIDRQALTPQQRLAISRRALVQQWRGEAPPPAPRAGQDGTAPSSPRKPGWLYRFSWTPMLRSVAERWWRRHPANAVGQIARPLLERYAREQPAKLVTIAAATGAAVVLVRPWRLLSVGAVVAALLKSSDIADMVTTVMRKSPPH